MKQYKKLVFLFALVGITVLLCFSASAEILSGDCGAEGDNVKWSYDTETHVLHITGTGAIQNFKFNTAIWHQYLYEDMESVVIAEGVTAIGSYTFCGCPTSSISIPNSVTDIGKSAFYAAEKLTGIVLPDSVMTLGESAFADCISLTSVTLSPNLTKIPNWGFEGCTAQRASPSRAV